MGHTCNQSALPAMETDSYPADSRAITYVAVCALSALLSQALAEGLGCLGERCYGVFFGFFFFACKRLITVSTMICESLL